MSTQHRPADHHSRSRPEADPRATGSASRHTTPIADRTTGLPERVERTQLQARVAALERSLAESERRRQALVDQYELVLDERDHEAPSSESRTDPDGAIGRLRRWLPVVG